VQVLSVLPTGAALCRGSEGNGPAQPIDTSLLESPPCTGDWLLVHIDVAVRRLGATEAQQIADALRAVAAAAAGEPFEHLLADLIEREPELPAHLQAEVAGRSVNG